MRHIQPGEFSKVIGLDRVPEVRTMREKIGVLASTGKSAEWMKEIIRSWNPMILPKP